LIYIVINIYHPFGLIFAYDKKLFCTLIDDLFAKGLTLIQHIKVINQRIVRHIGFNIERRNTYTALPSKNLLVYEIANYGAANEN
jgi:hypothetical protein